MLFKGRCIGLSGKYSNINLRFWDMPISCEHLNISAYSWSKLRCLGSSGKDLNRGFVGLPKPTSFRDMPISCEPLYISTYGWSDFRYLGSSGKRFKQGICWFTEICESPGYANILWSFEYIYTYGWSKLRCLVSSGINYLIITNVLLLLISFVSAFIMKAPSSKA